MWNREEIIAVLRVHFKLGSKKGKEKGIIISLPLFKDKGNNMFNKITETDSPPLALFFTPLLLPFHVTFLQLFTSKTNHEKLFQFSLSFSSQNKTEEIFPLELLAHFPFRFPFPYTSSKHKLIRMKPLPNGETIMPESVQENCSQLRGSNVKQSDRTIHKPSCKLTRMNLRSRLQKHEHTC